MSHASFYDEGPGRKEFCTVPVGRRGSGWDPWPPRPETSLSVLWFGGALKLPPPDPAVGDEWIPGE